MLFTIDPLRRIASSLAVMTRDRITIQVVQTRVKKLLRLESNPRLAATSDKIIHYLYHDKGMIFLKTALVIPALYQAPLAFTASMLTSITVCDSYRWLYVTEMMAKTSLVFFRREYNFISSNNHKISLVVGGVNSLSAISAKAYKSLSHYPAVKFAFQTTSGVFLGAATGKWFHETFLSEYSFSVEQIEARIDTLRMLLPIKKTSETTNSVFTWFIGFFTGIQTTV